MLYTHRGRKKMVLFGGYHTAGRFFDDDRLTAHFPGPGSYALRSTSAVEGATKYASRLVEDGVVRPDGSAIVFRERDSWVRGKEGPEVEIYKLKCTVHVVSVGICNRYSSMSEVSVLRLMSGTTGTIVYTTHAHLPYICMSLCANCC